MWAAQGSGREDDLVEWLLRAYFTEGRDISDVGVLDEIAAAVGLGLGIASSLDGDDAAAAAVRELQAGAEAVGLRGVPHHVLASRYAFSGAVATEEIVRVLRQVAAEKEPGA